MNYILRITTRYSKSPDKIRNWACKFYGDALKKMIGELEALQRQFIATELSDITGYTIEITEWVTLNEYKKVAWINYDLAL